MELSFVWHLTLQLAARSAAAEEEPARKGCNVEGRPKRKEIESWRSREREPVRQAASKRKQAEAETKERREKVCVSRAGLSLYFSL